MAHIFTGCTLSRGATTAPDDLYFDIHALHHTVVLCLFRLSGSGSSSDLPSSSSAGNISGYESESEADTDTGYSSDLHLDR